MLLLLLVMAVVGLLSICFCSYYWCCKAQGYRQGVRTQPQAIRVSITLLEISVVSVFQEIDVAKRIEVVEEHMRIIEIRKGKEDHIHEFDQADDVPGEQGAISSMLVECIQITSRGRSLRSRRSASRAWACSA